MFIKCVGVRTRLFGGIDQPGTEGEEDKPFRLELHGVLRDHHVRSRLGDRVSPGQRHLRLEDKTEVSDTGRERYDLLRTPGA